MVKGHDCHGSPPDAMPASIAPTRKPEEPKKDNGCIVSALFMDRQGRVEAALSREALVDRLAQHLRNR
jgi:hypothetical protein